MRKSAKKVIAATEENRRTLKQRLRASLAMLLVAIILMMFTTYAWIILSVAPEVSGISTTIGANGSLEIALLNDSTFSNPGRVPTAPGYSLSNNDLTANETWGNFVDLNDKGYGLQDIVLYPSRLLIKPAVGGNGYTVDRTGSMLLVPTYGADGRITTLTDKTVTGTYNGTSFYSYSDPDYGVRAIGTSLYSSVQNSALIQAKKNIETYMSGAKNSAIASVNGIQDLLLKFAGGTNVSFNQSDIDILNGMIRSLQTSEDYIESALRQGMLAYAASFIDDESEFETVRASIQSATPILTLLNQLGGFDGLLYNGSFITWAEKQDAVQNSLNAAYSLSINLDTDTATQQDIRNVLNYLMDMSQVMVDGKPFTEITKEDLMSLIGSNISLLLKPGSGVYADIADFAGNYEAPVGSLANLKTVSTVNPSYLSDMLAQARLLTAADGDATASDVELEDVFGYALDLAFRCNAYRSDLLLQTPGVQRVYNDSNSSAAMGGGSYMEFTLSPEMTNDRMIALMDAIRVAFVDDQDNILGIAKLNVSNRTINEANGNIMAPLYLYDFEVGTEGLDNGRLFMGERRKVNNVLTTLDQNIAKGISTLVWLDGDIVDNTMVSTDANLAGVLNLQFSSSADLLPAENNTLRDYVVDKDGLAQMITDVYNDYIRFGRSNYTTISWNNLVTVYERAEAVNSNAIASENLIYNTKLDLDAAVQALQTLDGDFLDLMISQVRELMGETTENARLLYKQDANDNPVLLSSYTQEQLDDSFNIWIKSVDHSKNLRDEGNDLFTPIYTEESWNNLAGALYFAEAVKHCSFNPDVKDNAAIRLQAALDGLDFAVFFTPYEYEDTLYYKAFSNDTDTYGIWYYSDMTRVLNESTMLELDAYAVEARFASIVNVPEWIPQGATVVTPYLNLYYTLKNQSILGVFWDKPEEWEYVHTADQESMFADCYANAVAIEAQIPEFVTSVLYQWVDSNKVVHYELNYNTTIDEADTAIALLQAAIEKKTADDVVADTAPLAPSVRIMLTQAVRNAKIILENSKKPGVANNSKLTALNNAVRSAEALLSNTKATNGPAKTALKDLNASIAQFDAKLQVDQSNAYPMTDNQRIVLNKAVLNAQSVTGYDDVTIKTEKMVTLRNAVAVVEAALVDPNTSNIDADSILNDLNTALARFDNDLVVTEYNYIEYSVPSALGDFDQEYQTAMYAPTFISSFSDRGTYSFGATLITTAGVVYRTDVVTTTGYVAAKGAYMPHLKDDLPVGGSKVRTWASTGYYGEASDYVYAWDGKMKLGSTVTLPDCQFLIDHSQWWEWVGTGEYEDVIVGTDENGEPITESVEIMEQVLRHWYGYHTETIKNVTYSFSQSGILKLVEGTTFEAIGTGTVTIYVTLESEQGNTYSASYPVEIKVVS